MKHTDYQEVRNLAKNILLDDRRMVQLTDDLEKSLISLQSTFLDDGMEEVQSFINTFKPRLVEAQKSFTTLANELIAYAALLEKGKL